MPRNDVYLFPLKLIDYVLNPDAAEPDAGAHGVDSFLASRHCYLGSRARFTGDSLKLDHASMDLWDLELKEATHQIRMAAREQQPRTFISAIDLHQIQLKSLPHTVALAPHLLLSWQCALDFAQVDDDLPGLYPLDNAAHDFSLSGGEFPEDEFTLRLTQTLHHHLLCGLGCNSPRVGRSNLHSNGLAKLSVFLYLPSFGQ